MRARLLRAYATTFVGRVIFVGALLLLWEFASGRLIPTFFVSYPSKVGERLLKWLIDGTFLYHLQPTAFEAALGFIIGAVSGLAVGLILGTSGLAARISHPVIMGLYSLPKVALIPLFILWFGIGIESKVALAGVLVFFLVLFNTMAGVRDVERDLVDAVRVMGGSDRTLFVKVILPSALNVIFIGLRISLPQALVGAVVGELWASSRGIGYLVGYSGMQFDVTGTLAALFGLLIISLSLGGVLSLVENRMLRWRRLRTIY